MDTKLEKPALTKFGSCSDFFYMLACGCCLDDLLHTVFSLWANTTFLYQLLLTSTLSGKACALT